MRLCLFVLALLPLISFGEEPPSKIGEKQFAMIKGQGVPVCEAYLELLNQTQFERTPFCGRPETGPAPFAPLERRDLGVDEILPLFNYVFEFMRFDDQHHTEKFFHSKFGSDEKYWSTDATTPEVIKLDLDLHWLHVWSYKTPVDIGNDGMPLNLLVWQGYGVWGGGGNCGVNYKWGVPYNPQRVFVLSADGKTIDEGQTRSIFGLPKKSSSEARGTGRPPTSHSGLPAGATPFEALADSIGVFGYDGRIYIQTENTPASPHAEPPPVKVFLREQGHTTQVCTFRAQNAPIP